MLIVSPILISTFVNSQSYVPNSNSMESNESYSDFIQVDGMSMEPSFHNGSIVYYSENFSKEDIKKDSVIIFSNPKVAGALSIKRIVATEGTISVKNNVLYVDGLKTKYGSQLDYTDYYIHDAEWNVEEDSVFVVGDNYNNSVDSRSYGSIPISSIVGIVKEWFIMFTDKTPHKVVVYYDIQSDEFLVRLINENWEDIVKYDTLPVLCKISDLFVKVIDVSEHQYLSVEEDTYGIIVNDDYIFRQTGYGKVLLYSTKYNGNPNLNTVKEEIKLMFEIPFPAVSSN